MNSIKKFLLKLDATALLVIIFYSLLIITNAVFSYKIECWKELIIFELIVTALIVSLAIFKNKNATSKTLKTLNYWYPAILIFATYKQLFFMIRPIRNTDYDQLLIQLDKYIFHSDPTSVLYKIANPFLTEILQIIYFSFYLLPVLLAAYLYLEHKYEETNYVIFAVVYGFFLSYMGYFLLPGVGPRFTLHNFLKMDQELPGLYLAEPLRRIINLGGSVNTGFSITDNFQRDVFPSGHTMITIIVMYLGIKFKCLIRKPLLVAGSLLIFSTVYLRYHYGVDLIAGALFAVVSLWSSKKLYNVWQIKTKRNVINY